MVVGCNAEGGEGEVDENNRLRKLKMRNFQRRLVELASALSSRLLDRRGSLSGQRHGQLAVASSGCESAQ